MTRVAVLRAGYAALGLAFVALAGSAFSGGLILIGLAAGFLAGVLLAVSDDDLPRYAGLALIAYFVLSLLAFLAATPITIGDEGGFFVNKAPPDLAGDVIYWMGLLSPLVLAGAGIVAVWEHEGAPRALLVGGVAGFVLVGALTVVLVPDLDPVCATDPNAPGCAGAAERAAAEGQRQGDMLRLLTAASAVAAAAGALWAATRSDRYA